MPLVLLRKFGQTSREKNVERTVIPLRIQLPIQFDIDTADSARGHSVDTSPLPTRCSSNNPYAKKSETPEKSSSTRNLPIFQYLARCLNELRVMKTPRKPERTFKLLSICRQGPMSQLSWIDGAIKSLVEVPQRSGTRRIYTRVRFIHGHITFLGAVAKLPIHTYCSEMASNARQEIFKKQNRPKSTVFCTQASTRKESICQWE